MKLSKTQVAALARIIVMTTRESNTKLYNEILSSSEVQTVAEEQWLIINTLTPVVKEEVLSSFPVINSVKKCIANSIWERKAKKPKSHCHIEDLINIAIPKAADIDHLKSLVDPYDSTSQAGD